MGLFLGGIVFLILGYFTYGRLVEKIIAPDDRATPALAQADGVDYVPLPKWKNLLIQLLNIAGVGPVIGVIAGIKFGKVALIIIPLGCVLMGAVHDFCGGMMSMRLGGANLPRIIRERLGKKFSVLFAWFMMILLLLVVAVFINVPATLIDKTWLPQIPFFWWAVGIIFAYYIIATLFPVDKIIGAIYPFFGALLIIGSVAICAALLYAGFCNPEILSESAAFLDYKNNVFNANGRSPLFPLLFVTIACGIISGFHATQSPIVARTIRSEREARVTFYGMMIAEGVIAMIWAAAALAIYNLHPEFLSLPPATVLSNITSHFLGPYMGGVTVFAVVVLAITSGDTALRSSRLSLAEVCSIDQIRLLPRVLTCLPLIAVVTVLLWWSNMSAKSFGHLWNYFAWGNQVLAATTLMASAVWLLQCGKKWGALIAALPGLFMTTVVVSFILWASADKGQPWGIVWKFSDGRLVNCGLPLAYSIILGACTAIVIVVLLWRKHLRPTKGR